MTFEQFESNFDDISEDKKIELCISFLQTGAYEDLLKIKRHPLKYNKYFEIIKRNTDLILSLSNQDSDFLKFRIYFEEVKKDVKLMNIFSETLKDHEVDILQSFRLSGFKKANYNSMNTTEKDIIKRILGKELDFQNL